MPNNRWRSCMNIDFFDGIKEGYWFNRPLYKRAYKVYVALIRSGRINDFPEDKRNFMDTVQIRMQGGIAEMDPRVNQKIYTTDFIHNKHDYEIPKTWIFSKKKRRGSRR